jgi:opacity protein-like surface antigen
MGWKGNFPARFFVQVFSKLLYTQVHSMERHLVKLIKLKIASVIAACFTATTAWAAMPLPWGWYIEGDLGKSVTSTKHYAGYRVQNTGFAGSIEGGYKFTQYIAGELGFTRYAQVRMKGPFSNTFATDQHYSYDLAGKLMLPIAQTGLNIFGKLGIGRINSYTTLTNPQVASANCYYVDTGVHSHNAFYLGGGAEFAILSHLLVNAQWERAKGTNLTGDLDLYSAGVSYIF